MFGKYKLSAVLEDCSWSALQILEAESRYAKTACLSRKNWLKKAHAGRLLLKRKKSQEILMIIGID